MTNTNINTTENLTASQLLDQIIKQVGVQQGPVVLRCEKPVGSIELFIGVAAIQPKGEKRIDLMPMLLSEMLEQLNTEELVESIAGTRH